jgi:hypothetical protein
MQELSIFQSGKLFLQQKAHLSSHQLYRSGVAPQLGRNLGNACASLRQLRKLTLFRLSPGFRLALWHLIEHLGRAIFLEIGLDFFSRGS